MSDVLARALGAAVLASASALAPPALAADPPTPGPGLYLIESESVLVAPPAVPRKTLRVDAATSAVTVTDEGLSPGQPPVTRRLPGKEPNTWCVSAERPSYPAPPTAPADQRLDERWRRLDDAHWERTLRRDEPMRLPPGPGGAAVAAAMEPDLDAIEDRVRNGTPREAEEARFQLSVLRGQLGNAGNPGRVAPSLEVTEKWSLVAPACTPRR